MNATICSFINTPVSLDTSRQAQVFTHDHTTGPRSVATVVNFTVNFRLAHAVTLRVASRWSYPRYNVLNGQFLFPPPVLVRVVLVLIL